MSTYIVSYDLHKKGEMNYEKLIAAIQTYSNWCKPLESDWIILSDSSAKQIRDHLLPFIHKDDKLLVARLSGEAAWHGFSTEIADWLRKWL